MGSCKNPFPTCCEDHLITLQPGDAAYGMDGSMLPDGNVNEGQGRRILRVKIGRKWISDTNYEDLYDNVLHSSMFLITSDGRLNDFNILPPAQKGNCVGNVVLKGNLDNVRSVMGKYENHNALGFSTAYPTSPYATPN